MELDKIYNEDCLVGMTRIPDKSIDCIICDLPYQVLHKNNPHAQWDRMIPFEPLWEQYERIIKDNGTIILFAQGMFTAHLMMSNPKLWRYNLVWDKCRVTGFLNANRMPLRCHEDICVFYKSLPIYNPQLSDGEPNHPQGNGKHRHTNQCYGEYGKDPYAKCHNTSCAAREKCLRFTTRKEGDPIFPNPAVWICDKCDFIIEPDPIVP